MKGIMDNFVINVMIILKLLFFILVYKNKQAFILYKCTNK